MISLCKWSIGPIEVICLVIFVGYSVTFGLHVSHNYAQAGPKDPGLLETHERSKLLKTMGWRAWKTRIQTEVLKAIRVSGDAFQSGTVATLTSAELKRARTRVAVLHVGGAILSAAVSTI